MRRFAAIALAASALFISATALAEQGSIVLVSGQVMVGEIQTVVQGEYIIVKLPSGEVKAIAWAQIGSFQIGGGASVSTGNPTSTPPPTSNTPPPPVYTPPPPPPNYYNAPPPPPPPPPRPAFNPAFMLGARIGSMAPSGYITGGGTSSSSVAMSEYAKAGAAFEADVGVHFSPAWTFYGFWEYGMLGRGSSNAGAPDTSGMNTVGLGMNANTSPRGPIGLYADVAIGYRWFNFSQASFSVNGNGIATSTYNRIVMEGIMPLRIALGMSIVATEKMRIDLAGQVSVGTFSRMKGGACPDGCDVGTDVTTSGGSSVDSGRGTHVTTGLVAGIRWDI